MTRPLRELRGNQLAQALRSAGVVPPPPPSPTAPIPPTLLRGAVDITTPKPPPSDETLTFAPADSTHDIMLTPEEAAEQDALVRDVRSWLERLVAGERIPIRHITEVVPQYKRQQIGNRLKARGLITVTFGSHGGASATPKLLELARETVTDEQLREIALTEYASEAAEDTGDVANDADEPPAYDPPRVRGATSKAGRDSQRVEALRGWLTHGVGGGRLQLVQLNPNTGGKQGGGDPQRIGAVLRELGYIERKGVHGHVWYEVPETMRDTVGALTDSQLADILWPSRQPDIGAPAEDPGSEPELPTVRRPFLPLVALTQPREEQPAQETTPGDQLTLLATRMGQFLIILEHVDARLANLDARFARIESELGLKPLEEEEPDA